MQDDQPYYGNGLEQSEYLKNVASLQSFNVIENDWKELFQWLISVGHHVPYFDDENKQVEHMGISNLWDNQIFTILIEIAQKNIDSYKDNFIQGGGTNQESKYTLDLEHKIQGWIRRINHFLNIKLKSGSFTNTNLSIQIAETIKRKLAYSLQALNKQDHTPSADFTYTSDGKVEYKLTQPYYNMLNTVNEIGQKCDLYIKQIEESGDIDPSLALLLTFVRNYANIVDKQNQLIATLPSFYRDHVLRARNKKPLPDITQLVINPIDSISDTYIPKGTAFLAGKNKDGTDLLYRTTILTKISHMKLKEAHSFYLKKEGDASSKITDIQHKSFDFFDTSKASSLFTDDDDSCAAICGWMIESPMFLLHEGERVVTICMNLTDKSTNDLNLYGLSSLHLDDLFTACLSCEEGWIESNVSVRYMPRMQELQFSIRLQDDAPFTSVCDEKTHEYMTDFPVLKLLLKAGKLSAYNWAILTEFNAITIKVQVDGIRHINLYNETGELDANVPFYPFGAQAKLGAWFVFENEELDIKPLVHVTLKGVWNQLPYGKKEVFSDIYKNYLHKSPITNQSFRVKTEWQENKVWHESDENTQKLFQESSNDSIDENCIINFKINTLKSKISDSSRKQDCLFRTTLVAPSIGFGIEEYRTLFAEVMTYNSRGKSKKSKPLPVVPVIPTLSNIEISYLAEHTLTLNDIKGNEKTMLYRISSLSRTHNYPIISSESAFLVEELENNNFLIGLENSIGESSIRIYFDLLSYQIDIFENRVSIGNTPTLSWKYHNDLEWGAITLADGTNGLTHSGYMELTFPEQISEKNLDTRGYLWLLMSITGDTKQCLAIRSIFLNCITVVADGGDGSSLAAETIKQSLDELHWVEDIMQPFSGTQGKVVEDDEHLAARLAHRSAHRNRAVNPSDYEQMIIERFPEIEKAYCIPRGGKHNPEHVVIVVLSRMNNTLFPNTPVWLLVAIKEYLTQYVSPWVKIEVINPIYEKLEVICTFVPKEDEDIGMTTLRMNGQINQYFARWMTECALPKINQTYSYKGLYTILANDEGINELKGLFVNGHEIVNIDFNKEDTYIKGKYIWSIFIPKDIHAIRVATIEEGIGRAVISGNFIIA